ncbi:MAG: M14 family metallopeptidase [Bacteroidales bacterium]|nr:M14 family metallopeptidase [Bacteroidales bacterium]
MKKQLYISIILMVIFINPLSAQKVEVPLRFDRYYSYEDVVKAITLLNQAYPKLTKKVLVGKSDEGRDIWALEINNPATGKALDKSGVYVDANIHGNEIQAGEVALYLADYLLKNYGKLEQITQVVNRNAFYIIPVVNVDGRYHFFTDANTMHSSRSLRIPKDDDRDGLFDEDFPDDLDGDGNICQMRKHDPNGKYRLDPLDPRIMIRVKNGEKGEWTLLGSEGIDNDGDGRINEDAEGYVDPNRNWGFYWQPNYVQRGAGDFPMSGKGIKAIAEYLYARPNIIVVYAFHNYGGMFLRGPGAKELGPMNPQDVAVHDLLGKNAEKIVPGYRYLISWKDLYSTYGDFTQFTYSTLGAYSYVGELFRTEQETYSKKQPKGEDEQTWNSPMRTERERERLKFNDNLAHGSLYKEWKPYHHPVYGDIEIGGWVKMSTRIPHTFMLPELVHRNASAVIFSASQTPDISMEVFETKKMGNNLYRVNVRLKNKNGIPSMSYIAQQKKIHPKDILKISGKGIKVIAGGKLNDKYTEKANYKEYRPEIQFLSVPAFGFVEYTFLISGKGNVNLSYHSQAAKDIAQTIKLN